MGSLCSKPATHSGTHTVVQRTPAARPKAINPQAQSPSDPRAAAAEAAERRLKAAQARGTSASNPQQGRLAAQLAKQSKTKVVPTEQEGERLVTDPSHVRQWD